MDGSGEKIIGTAAGCVKARSIKRKPEAERWDVEMMKSLRGTPWEVVPGHKDRALQCRVIVDRTDRGQDVPGMPAEPEEVIGIIYITKRDLIKYGRTEGCPGCRASLREGDSKPHNKECRERIEKEMKKEEDARYKRWDNRVNERISKILEENDKKEDHEGNMPRDHVQDENMHR